MQYSDLLETRGNHDPSWLQLAAKIVVGDSAGMPESLRDVGTHRRRNRLLTVLFFLEGVMQ